MGGSCSAVLLWHVWRWFKPARPAALDAETAVGITGLIRFLFGRPNLEHSCRCLSLALSETPGRVADEVTADKPQHYTAPHVLHRTRALCRANQARMSSDGFLVSLFLRLMYLYKYEPRQGKGGREREREREIASQERPSAGTEAPVRENGKPFVPAGR